MLTLALDTATETLSLALSASGVILCERHVDAGREHLELLLPNIHVMLREQGAGIADLEALVVGIGPGTFSGLRVGIVTARGLAQALEIPIVGVSTLDALARGLAAGAGPRFILPVVDARRGQVFTRMFESDGHGSLRSLSGIECLDPETLAEFASHHADGPAVAGGNGVQAYYDALTGFNELQLTDDDALNCVSAARLLEQASLHGETKAGVSGSHGGNVFEGGDLAALVPIYVREPDADKTALLRKREPWQT